MENQNLVLFSSGVPETRKRPREDRVLVSSVSYKAERASRTTPYTGRPGRSASGFSSPQNMGYTREDGRMLLQFISKFKLHKYVGGNEVWKRIETLKLVPFHTWQSLREHFTKTVLPNLGDYGPSDEDVQQFEEYQLEKKMKRRHNIPPDVLIMLQSVAPTVEQNVLQG